LSKSLELREGGKKGMLRSNNYNSRREEGKPGKTNSIATREMKNKLVEKS